MLPLRPKREGTDTNQAPATVERPRTKMGRDPSLKRRGEGAKGGSSILPRGFVQNLRIPCKFCASNEISARFVHITIHVCSINICQP